MKKQKVVLVVISAIFIVLLTAVMLYRGAHNSVAEKIITEHVALLEANKQIKGAYPVGFSYIEPYNQGLKVWGFLPGPHLSYVGNGENFEIFYRRFPVGPHYGYRSETKSWEYF